MQCCSEDDSSKNLLVNQKIRLMFLQFSYFRSSQTGEKYEKIDIYINFHTCYH